MIDTFKNTSVSLQPTPASWRMSWAHCKLLVPQALPPTKNFSPQVIRILIFFFPCTFSSVQFSSVTQSCPTLCDIFGLQHARSPCPSPTPGVYQNSCLLRQWCHPTISFSVVPFSSCPQSLPASGSFQMSQLFASGGQSIGSVSFNISPSNEHPGLISFRMDWLGLLAVQGTFSSFSNTTVQKHQFFSAQLSL